MSVNRLMMPETYPKIRRLPMRYVPSSKRDTVMPKEIVKELFDQEVLIEEKMDGKVTRFDTKKGMLRIFCEDLKHVHSIRYRIPARFAVFDIFDTSRMMFLSDDEMDDTFSAISRGIVKVHGPDGSNFFKIPVLAKGRFSMQDVPQFIEFSHYAIEKDSIMPAWMEGVVIKPSRLLLLPELQRYGAKLVRKEFVKGITDNYHDRPTELNEINPIFAIRQQ